MATLTCKDGTVIKISDETEDSLRQAFEPKAPKPPTYKDDHITVGIDVGCCDWPIDISTDEAGHNEVSRNVEDVEALIVALQTAVTYCKQHNLGVD